jgi:steroid 5-alpha reductase family enzyme
MSGHLDVLGAAALAIIILMTITWIISLIITDASIVDIVWGFGFVVATWTGRFVADGNDARINLLTALVTIWGLRLASYLAWRNLGKGEDFRYQLMRKHWSGNFAIKSLYRVFGFQGLLMFIVVTPVLLAMTPTEPDIGIIAVVGVALWGVGFFFETVGDVQLARFKANPDNAGKVMDQGLWRYTRHPNYFGDFCVWWGIFLVAVETGDAAAGIIGPIVMSVLLTRVSGVPMLERGMTKRRPGYEDYVARTSSFFPRPPRATS